MSDFKEFEEAFEVVLAQETHIVFKSDIIDVQRNIHNNKLVNLITNLFEDPIVIEADINKINNSISNYTIYPGSLRVENGGEYLTIEKQDIQAIIAPNTHGQVKIYVKDYDNYLVSNESLGLILLKLNVANY